MNIKSLKTLLKKIISWLEKDIPQAREKNDAEGRSWFLKSIEYDKTLKLEDLRGVTDRSELNGEFKARYEEKSTQGRKGISALKVEISALYSFNKSFVERYKGRSHFYKDDLSQKSSRVGSSTGRSFALFEEFKKNLD